MGEGVVKASKAKQSHGEWYRKRVQGPKQDQWLVERQELGFPLLGQNRDNGAISVILVQAGMDQGLLPHKAPLPAQPCSDALCQHFSTPSDLPQWLPSSPDPHPLESKAMATSPCNSSLVPWGLPVARPLDDSVPSKNCYTYHLQQRVALW